MPNSQSPLIQRDGGVGISLAAQLDDFPVEVPISIKPINWNVWFIWWRHSKDSVGIGLPLANRLFSCFPAYTEYRGWRCRWRPPRCTWWRTSASPCVSLCWAPKYSHSGPWTSRQSSGTLLWSLPPAHSSPTCLCGRQSWWAVVYAVEGSGGTEQKHAPYGCRRLPIGGHTGGHWHFQIGWTRH